MIMQNLRLCSLPFKIKNYYLTGNLLNISFKFNFQVKALLSSDDLNVKSELTVFDGVLGWIKHDKVSIISTFYIGAVTSWLLRFH